MPCPKCGGTARRLDLVTAEGRLMVNSCINCGRVFGDAVIDYHRGLAHPPRTLPAGAVGRLVCQEHPVRPLVTYAGISEPLPPWSIRRTNGEQIAVFLFGPRAATGL